MATLAFSVAGGALGQSLLPAGVSLFGQTLGGAAIGQAVGGLAGAAVDNVLFGASLPRQRVEGPRLSELRVSGSEYGSAIPLVYGAACRLSGTVIWMGPVAERKSTRTETHGGGGKGGGSSAKTTTTTYSYDVSLALGLCQGPVRALRRIWADGRLLWEAGQELDGLAAGLQLYPGDAAQAPSPVIESVEGAGRVPAYRGLAYLVLERLELGPFGNRLPNFTFEVALPPERTRLSDALVDLCARAGVGPVQALALEGQPLRGYAIPRLMSAREAIEPLQRAYFFDIREQDGQLAFRPLVQAAQTRIPAEDLGAFDADGRATADFAEGAPVPRLASRRADVHSLPRALAVQYADVARDHQAGVQQARRRESLSRSETELQLPLLLTADEARSIAERSLALAWQQRVTHEITLPPAYRRLGPGDVVSLELEGAELQGRILERRFAAPGLLSLELVADRTGPGSALEAAAPPGVPALAARNRAPARNSPTHLILLDLPALRSQDAGAGFYVALSPADPALRWPGALVEGGGLPQPESFRSLAESETAAVTGRALTILPPGPVTHWDRAAAVELQLDDPERELDSLPEDQVAAGRNLLWLGGEILQFASAELMGPGSYRLSRLLRGRLGTEAAVAGHKAEETAVLLDGPGLGRIALDVNDLGRPRWYRAVTWGRDGDDAEVTERTCEGRALQPWAPVHLRGRRAGNDDLAITWVRRARLDRRWRDGFDVALEDGPETYELEVLQDGAVLRRETCPAPEFTYTAVQQQADFGTVPSSVRLRVCQISPVVGRGQAREAEL
ncbi:phage tail protein [Fodinicurvata halophila]|uniref:Phage tail protein n=1 Tax=Fodinicurvata halophila TaxID=1419723 RepID=A0ABV8UQQ0_9PROT